METFLDADSTEALISAIPNSTHTLTLRCLLSMEIPVSGAQSSTKELTFTKQYSIFNDYAGFIGSDFKEYNTYFWYSRFNGDVDFIGSIFDKNTDFNNVEFKGNAIFDECIFNGDARFEGAIFNKHLPLTKTQFNKFYIRWFNIKEGIVYDDTAYMSLLQNFKNLGYFEDYDNCYYQYRVEHRNRPWPGISLFEVCMRKFGDVFLRYFYGYGKKPLYPLGWSFFSIIFFALIWKATGLNAPFRFSFRAFLSGTKLFIDPPKISKQTKSSKPMFDNILVVERALGAIFSVLFFLAVSGTVIR